MYRCISLVLLLPLLISCGGKPVFKDPVRPNLSLALIYIDMQQAPSRSEWVSAKRLKPKTKKPYFRFGHVKDKNLGLINHNQYIEPGLYKFAAFGGVGRGFLNSNSIFEYAFPAQGRGLATMNVKKPGVYFVGSFRYVKVKTGFFEAKKFDIERINKPTEKEVLTQFLPHMEEGRWKQMVKKRLRQLK